MLQPLLDKFVLRSHPLATRTIEGEGVVITLADKHVHHFNPSATVVWEAIDGEHTVREIVASLCAVFDVAVDEAPEDVVKLVTELETKGIATLAAEPRRLP